MSKFILVFSLLITQLSIGQIKGEIWDDNKNPIPNIIIKLFKDNKLIAYTTSNQVGFYILKIDETGSFELVFSSLTYEEVNVPLQIKDFNQSIEINAELKPKEVVHLNETIVLGDKPIVVKNDTIVYNADSFLQGNEQVVEDLLKKLPGITVEEDGTIKAGEKEVEKVMIEDDDFFEKGYKIVTKNMPVRPVDKVELLQHYSENKHLKGVEDSDKVALNLTLKEDAKNQWFGSFDGGLDILSANFYKATANVMNFGKKNKYYFLTNLNNIGVDATGEVSHLVNPSSRAKDFVGDGFKTIRFMDLSGFKLGFDADRTKMNNEELISLNSIFNPNKKLKIKPILFWDSDENWFRTGSVEKYILPNHNSFTNTENDVLRKSRYSVFGKVDVSYDLTKNQAIESSSRFNMNKGEDRGDIDFNQIRTLENLKSNTSRFDQEIQFTKKLSESKVILLQGRFTYDEIEQNYKTNQNYFSEFIENSNSNVKQNSHNKGSLYGFKFRYLDKQENGNLLEVNVINKWEIQNLTNRLLLSENPFLNKINYQINDFIVEGAYVYKLKDKLKLRGEILGQNFNQNYENIDISQKNNTTQISPALGLKWEPFEKHQFNLSYKFGANPMDLTFLHSKYILKNYRNLSSGLDQPNVFTKSSLSFVYTLGKFTDKIVWNNFLSYNTDYDYVTSQNVVYQNFSVNEYFTFKNRKSFMVNSTLDYYLKNLSSNLKFKAGFFNSSFSNRVNNSDLRNIENNNLNYGLELRSAFDGIFNFHVGTKNTHSGYRVNNFKNHYFNNNSFLDTYFMVSKNFDFQTNLDYYYFGNLQKDNHYFFLDVGARYKLKDKRISFGLKGKNLFNVNSFNVTGLTDISESVTSYQILPRYIMATIEFGF